MNYEAVPGSGYSALNRLLTEAGKDPIEGTVVEIGGTGLSVVVLEELQRDRLRVRLARGGPCSPSGGTPSTWSGAWT